MITALRNFERLHIASARHAVNKTMLARNPTRPEPFEISAKWFRLASACEWMTAGFFDQAIQFRENLAIFALPMEIFSPSTR
jgi:hypothetical protein